MKRCRYVVFLLLISAIDTYTLSSRINSITRIPDFKSTPSKKWVFRTRAPLFPSPVPDENFVYIGSTDSTLYALYISSGKGKWEFHTNGEIRSDAFIDGKLYCLTR